METVNRYLFDAMRRFADRPMQVHRDRVWTYREAATAVHGVFRALFEHGIVPGDRVALIAENSPRWLHAYLGVLAAGAVVVPRGADIGDSELRDILAHSGSKLVLAESGAVAARLPDGLPVIRFDEGFPDPVAVDDATLEAWSSARAEDDLAVLLYTSGTTGRPKGVMLEHRNLAHNIRVLPPLVDMAPGDSWVSVLPSWHTFEQTIELTGHSIGCITIYSDRRRLRDDLRKHRPQFFASVPRIWETIHDAARKKIDGRGGLVRALFRLTYAGSRMWRRGNPLGWPLHKLGQALFYGKIAEATGGRLKYAVSGGGYIPRHVDEFFVVVGIQLLVGYGLTETAPVVAVRRPEDNVLGTIGRAVPETEFRIGPERTLQVRGPQVMRGYYKDDELTNKVLSDDGWFDTGDIITIREPKGDLVFVGRAKETIVLSGGENVEPEPIEQSLLQARGIHQVMVVGQDRKALGALVVPDPEDPASDDAIRAALKERTGTAGGFRTFEAVHKFARVEEPFTPENGLLTKTLKMRRAVIAERYAESIDGMY